MLGIGVALCVACGDDNAELTPDAGGGIDGGGEILGIAMAMLPQIGPCPEGWAATPVGEAEICEPPIAAPDPCPDGSAQRLGQTECAPLGPTCPEGDFAADLPPGTIYVRGGGATSGSGTLDNPFRTLRSATSSVRPGTVIAIAKGIYEEHIDLPDGTRLIGACAGETVLRATESMVPIIRLQEVENVSVENLSLDGNSLAPGIAALRSTWSVKNVDARDTVIGFAVDGGSADFDTVRSRGAHSTDAALGLGMLAVRDARVAGRNIVLADNVRDAVAESGAVMEFEDTRALRAAGQNEYFGAGFDAIGPDTRIELTNCECAGSHGICISATLDAHVELDGVVVRDVQQTQPGAMFGYGIAARQASVTAKRVSVRGARYIGIRGDSPSTLDLEDVLVHGTMPGINTPLAAGIGSTSNLRLNRVYIAESGGAGLLSVGAQVQGSDVVVVDTRTLTEEPNGTDGLGVGISRGTVLDLERIRIERSVVAGVMVTTSQPMSHVTLRDLVVRDMASSMVEQRGGMAVAIRDAIVNIDRAYLERTHEATITAFGQRTEVNLWDVRIQNAMARPCADDTCADAPGGHGVGSYLFATVNAENLQVDEAALCGVQVANDGQIMLTGGSIRNSEVGLCVQVEGFDLEAALNNVEFEGNGISVDQDANHSVPEPPGLDLNDL